MKKNFNRSFTSLSCAFALALIASTVQPASLPKDIEVDIIMKNITSLIKEKNYIEALPYFEQLEAMNVPLPESFYYFKIKALDKTTDTKKTLTQSQSYFTDYGKSGEYYNEVLEIYSRVSMRDVKEEAVVSELHIKTEKELAEKKRIDAGWRMVSSKWRKIPTTSNGCGKASSLIVTLHPSARNIDCDCNDEEPDHPAYRGVYETICLVNWQRNPLLENNKSLHYDKEYKKNWPNAELLRSEEQ